MTTTTTAAATVFESKELDNDSTEKRKKQCKH